MHLHSPHALSVSICAAAGVLSYSTFLIFLCRSAAVGNKKDGSRLELFHRVASLLQAASDPTGQPPSDCPALSEILATVASTRIIKPGTELLVTNSPHSPLVLEITRPSGDYGGSTRLVAYHYRIVEDRLFRESEMTFEVSQDENRFSLKAIHYLPANPKYLKAFAMVWSDELMKKGYLEAVKSRFVIAKAA
ncbi:MAG: hypothetical protein JWQ49_5113 [Edaphobacter sp.]|nr:hypothetical protein [Edaphobacter sp.]